MRKTALFLAILFISVLLVFFATKSFYEKRLEEIKKEVDIYKEMLSDKENQTRNLSDIFFLSQKAKAEVSVKKTDLYFSYKMNKLESGLFKISIYFEGDNKAAADAADIKINLKNLEVKSIFPGKAFPSYPRSLAKDNYLLVTGTAVLQGSSFVYGKPELFAELTIGKTDQTEKSEAVLDLEGTKVYLGGESVFNAEKTFKKILID